MAKQVPKKAPPMFGAQDIREIPVKSGGGSMFPETGVAAVLKRSPYTAWIDHILVNMSNSWFQNCEIGCAPIHLPVE